MGIMEGGMNWEQMKQIVERQLNKLAMCKRGAIATDINKQLEKLGKCPSYTTEERREIKEALASKVKKAMTPSLTDVKKYSVRELSSKMQDRANKVMDKCYEHPGEEAWRKAQVDLKRQKDEREATLDGDVQDILDQFTLGIKAVEDFPAIRDDFEAKEW